MTKHQILAVKIAGGIAFAGLLGAILFAEYVKFLAFFKYVFS